MGDEGLQAALSCCRVRVMSDESEQEAERREMHEYRCEVAASVRIVARVVEMNSYQRQTLLSAATALEEQS